MLGSLCLKKISSKFQRFFLFNKKYHNYGLSVVYQTACWPCVVLITKQTTHGFDHIADQASVYWSLKYE